MRKLLQTAGVGLAAASLLGWLAFGSNVIWTRTSVTKWQRDPVTEIDGPVIEKKFVPGIDLLVLGLSGALALFVASLFVSKTQNKSVGSQYEN